MISGRSESEQEKAASLVAALVAFAFHEDPSLVMAHRRGSDRVSWARQVAMYLVYVTSGLSLAKVAAAFRRDRSTVAHACHLVEDRREDPHFDCWLEQMEEVVESAFRLRERIDKGGAADDREEGSCRAAK